MWKVLAFLAALAGIPLAAQITISGVALDQKDQPIAAVSVKIESTNKSALVPVNGTSDTNGQFSLRLDSPTGEYLISAAADGFQAIAKEPIYLETGISKITVKLTPIETFSVDVRPDGGDEIILEKVESSQTLTKREIIDIPFTNPEKFENIVGFMPGVVLGPKGQLFFDGSSADQNNYLLDGFSINDPISYRLQAHINTQGVESFDRFSGRYSPEFGKGSGGTLAVYPQTGGSKIKYGITNFFPGIEFFKGLTLSSYDPQLSLSGPIIKDRLFFFNTLDLGYRQNIIAELPEGHDRTRQWNANNLMHLHGILTTRNILSSNFMVNYLDAPKTGLSPLNPLETSTDNRSRIYFFNIKNQTFGQKTTVEFGYGLYMTTERQVPQGRALLQITPFGNSGNFPFDLLRQGGRHQFLLNVSWPEFKFLGRHRFKTGADARQSWLFQKIDRTGFEHIRIDGTKSSSTTFGGNSSFKKPIVEGAGYWQDEWAVNPWLFLKSGFRWDRDSFMPGNAFTPRFGVAAMPPFIKNTKFAFGWGVVPATSYLHLFTRDLDQYAINTDYDRSNGSALRQFLRIFIANKANLVIPKTSNLSFGIEHNLAKNLSLQANYLRKRTLNGYVYTKGEEFDPSLIKYELPPSIPIIPFNLSNLQTLEYDSLTLGLKKNFANGNFFSVAYTHSRGVSNAAIDPNVDEPIIYSDTAGPLSWDTPKRLVGYGLLYLDKGQKNSISGALEWRDGLPFTSNDEDGRQVGSFNGRRLPDIFYLNLSFERKLHLFKRNWAIRFGSENITNRANASAVNANTAIPGYPAFYGIQPRKFVARIRLIK